MFGEGKPEPISPPARNKSIASPLCSLCGGLFYLVIIMEIIECDGCGVKFEQYPDMMGSRLHFCSHACELEYAGIDDADLAEAKREFTELFKNDGF